MLLLTTHSMEEADTLGDRIAVFANGRLRCLGTSLHLKARHGSGYRLSIGLKPDTVACTADLHTSASTSTAATDEGSCSSAAAASGGSSSRSSPAAGVVVLAKRAVELLVAQVLGQVVEAEAAGELGLRFQLPAGCEGRLPGLLDQLQLQAEALGVADVQVRAWQLGGGPGCLRCCCLGL